MNCCASIDEEDYSEFVEVDPTGRYGRYNEILGKGASKTVYKAFDEYEGIEVAWNQVKLHDFLRNPEDLEKLYREIHLLKTLKHENIMKFYTSWVDTTSTTINFVTELFNSGTLRQYRMKHRRVNVRAVKIWCRQILKGLLYLHSHDPPIIHRDLKCDNIFINGNQGEVKIGDLGLAAILRKSHAVRCVGTPEFMAPEVYEEEYNELVDIYSFGMCMLEMVTFEYPYSECTHPAQIYKKVISGKKPEAFYKVKDPEVQIFVEKCLAAVSCRLPAIELLKDPFLQVDDDGFDMRPVDYYNCYNVAAPFLGQPRNGVHHNNSVLANGTYDYPSFDDEEGSYYQDQFELQMSEINLFANQDDEHLDDVDISIKGRRRDDDGIFLRLRIADNEGHIRNIYFHFDTKTDTALSVATEMVSVLDITDQDVAKIADMIDGEIATLVPDWRKEEVVQGSSLCRTSFCQDCASNGYLLDTISSSSEAAEICLVSECPKHGFGSSVHGRFEEITYQVERCFKESETPEALWSETDGIHYADIWAQREGPELSKSSKADHCDEEKQIMDGRCVEASERIINVDHQNETNKKKYSIKGSKDFDLSDDYENEIRQELRQLKARYQLQLMDLGDKQLGSKFKPVLTLNSIDLNKTKSLIPSSPSEQKRWNTGLPKKSSSRKQCDLLFTEQKSSETTNQGVQDCEEMNNGKRLHAGILVPHSLHRATSLPVDAIDV